SGVPNSRQTIAFMKIIFNKISVFMKTKKSFSVMRSFLYRRREYK
ncbi:MAG: hypothetical protein ACJA1B_002827, partial [Polaribacter sp.]